MPFMFFFQTHVPRRYGCNTVLSARTRVAAFLWFHQVKETAFAARAFQHFSGSTVGSSTSCCFFCGFLSGFIGFHCECLGST